MVIHFIFIIMKLWLLPLTTNTYFTNHTAQLVVFVIITILNFCWCCCSCSLLLTIKNPTTTILNLTTYLSLSSQYTECVYVLYNLHHFFHYDNISMIWIIYYYMTQENNNKKDTYNNIPCISPSSSSSSALSSLSLQSASSHHHHRPSVRQEGQKRREHKNVFLKNIFAVASLSGWNIRHRESIQ